MQYPRVLPLVLCLVPAAFSAQTSVGYSPEFSPGAQGPANTYAVDLNNDGLTDIVQDSDITGSVARMEVWVDGTKQYTETSSLTLDTELSVSAGLHELDFPAVNTAGTIVNTTVQ